MRHVLSWVAAVVLVGCGGGQTEKVADPEGEGRGSNTAEPVTVDAAPAVVEAPPPDPVPEPVPRRPPPPPVVAPLVKQTDAKALRKLIKKSKDPVDRLLLSGQLAEVLWRSSCKSDIDGLCLKTTPRKAKAPPACGTRKEVVTAVKRGATAKEARKMFKAVLAAWKDGAILLATPDQPTTPEELDAYTRNVHMAEEVALAMLAEADVRLEAMFALSAPTGLDFSDKHRAKSTKAFQAWFENLSKFGQEARRAYEKILFGQDKVTALYPEAMIIAATRLAQLSTRAGEEVAGMEIPRDVLTGGEDVINVYCDTLLDKAQPVLTGAGEAWKACAAKAAELGVTGRWAERCTRENAQQEPPDALR